MVTTTGQSLFHSQQNYPPRSTANCTVGDIGRIQSKESSLYISLISVNYMNVVDLFVHFKVDFPPKYQNCCAPEVPSMVTV